VGILPTYALLQRRHLRSDGGCPCCTKDVESVGHILWSCPVANDVWVESQLPLHKWDRYISSFFDLMVVVQSRLTLEEVEFFSCVAYFLWRQRNAWVHERMACNPMAVVQRAVVLLRDYKSSCTVRDCSHVVVSRRSDLVAAQAKWDPPLKGVFKVNWDFLVDSVSKRMSVGIIIRDHNGCVLAAKCSNDPILSSDVQPKVLACLSVLLFASEIGFYDVVLEGPPAVFLSDLHVKVLGPSIESMWLEEICWSILNCRTFSVSDISREANKGAVVLAKLGSSVKQAKIWLELEEVPVELEHS
jgi:hypothetical protein